MKPLTKRELKRFKSKYIRSSKNNCWLWIKPHRGGYGNFLLRKTLHPASRIAYFIANNIWPGKLLVRHTCDNPPCVNPYHLILGNHRDNMLDREIRGRGVIPDNLGSKHGMSKLTERKVIKIRRLRQQKWTIDKLAIHFRVSPGLISGICSGKSWRHVGGPLVKWQWKAIKYIGEDNNQSKLTVKQVFKIRRFYRRGKSMNILANKFKVSKSTIWRIITRRTWDHI